MANSSSMHRSILCLFLCNFAVHSFLPSPKIYTIYLHSRKRGIDFYHMELMLPLCKKTRQYVFTYTLSPYMRWWYEFILTGNCIVMSKEMLINIYKFCIHPYIEQQRWDSRKTPESDVTIRETCSDGAKKIYYFYNIQ